MDTLSCPGPQPPSVRGCSTLGSCWGTGTVQTTHLAVTCPCPSRLRRHLACVPTALPPRCSLVWFRKSPRLPWGVPCPGHPAGGAEQYSMAAWIQICFCTHSSARSFTLPVPQCPRSTEMARVLPVAGREDQEFFGEAVKPWDGTEQVLLTSLLLRLTITTNICITYLCYARTSRKMTLVSKVSEYPYNSKQDMGIKDTEPPPPQGVDGRLKMRRRCLTQARWGWGLGRSARPLTCSQSELTLLRC